MSARCPIASIGDRAPWPLSVDSVRSLSRSRQIPRVRRRPISRSLSRVRAQEAACARGQSRAALGRRRRLALLLQRGPLQRSSQWGHERQRHGGTRRKRNFFVSKPASSSLPLIFVCLPDLRHRVFCICDTAASLAGRRRIAPLRAFDVS